MKRIIVIGCPGSGKSTFSRKLHEITDISLYHLDMLNWNADKSNVPKPIFRERLNQVLNYDSWIIDGNYGSTMELRLQACDTVFFLDFPLDVCLEGVMSRRGKERTDMPWVELSDDIDEEFIQFIKDYNKKSRPTVIELLNKYHDKNIYILKSRNEADEFLTRLEIWDTYDKEMNKISNMLLIRGEVVPNGIYHLVSEIIVKHIDGTYLIMQRDLNKNFGGMWELTAGGSALHGESSLDCAIRELSEETGIVASNLKKIGKVVHDTHHSIYVEYLCITDCEKDSVRLQEGETINYKWIDKSNLLKMSNHKLASTRTIRLIKELDI